MSSKARSSRARCVPTDLWTARPRRRPTTMPTRWQRPLQETLRCPCPLSGQRGRRIHCQTSQRSTSPPWPHCCSRASPATGEMPDGLLAVAAFLPSP
jgi:hypothetical protein